MQQENEPTSKNPSPTVDSSGSLDSTFHASHFSDTETANLNNADAPPDREKLETSEGNAPDLSSETLVHDIMKNNKPDMVAGRFHIQTNHPVLQYCSEFAQAYGVTDKEEKDNDQLYCLVFNKGVPIRLNTINALKGAASKHFIAPLASEISYISNLKEYRFVVVLQQPKGISLTSYIETNGPKAEDFIAGTLIAQLTTVMDLLDNKQILHGRINPDNIFIDPPTRHITLGECVSNPAGFSQPILYETVDRATSMPLGKGEGDASSDYYALGVVALFTQIGKPPAVDIDEENILLTKLINGSFNALLKNIELSASLMDLYRGLLNDKTIMRWNCSQLKDWLKGKYFNLVRIPALIEATRSISFNDVQYFSLQALAYALYKHWKVSKAFLREDKLTKWIEGSVGNPDLAIKLRHAQKITTAGKAAGGIFDLDDELVARTIQLLNSHGPFQFKSLSININALGAVLAHEYSKKRTETIQTLGLCFAHNLFGYLELFGEKENQGSKLLWNVKNVTDYISKTSLGFGLERCLYELNPALPCQSPLVSSEFPLTTKELLEILDAKCEKSEEYPMDRHIAAFIANRINLTNDIRIQGLASYPKFSNNHRIQATALFMMGQKESGIKKLKHITSTMAKQLHSITDMLHGKTYKAEYIENIDKIAKEGNMSALYKVASDTQFILLDQQGFEEAQRQYLTLENQLTKLKGKNTIANLGYHYGLRLAVVIAYILCGLEFFYLVIR